MWHVVQFYLSVCVLRFVSIRSLFKFHKKVEAHMNKLRCIVNYFRRVTTDKSLVLDLLQITCIMITVTSTKEAIFWVCLSICLSSRLVRKSTPIVLAF